MPDPVRRWCDPCGRYGTSGSNGCDPESDPGRKDTSDFQYDAVGNSTWHAYPEYGSGAFDASGIYYLGRAVIYTNNKAELEAIYDKTE